MLKKIISIVPVAALTLTVSANVQAATITVQKGDTLSDLALANKTSVEEIQTINHLSTDLIHPGDILTVTRPSEYIVKNGDTLWDIANNHHITVAQIKNWSQIDSDLIHPGDVLTIAQEYTVEKGDTLSEIAEKFNTSVSKIKGWNQLDSDLIHPGLELVIFADSNTTTTSEGKASSEKETRIDEKSSSANNEVASSSAEKGNATTNDAAEESTAKVTAPSTASENTAKEKTTTKDDANKKEIIVEATAYTASCEGCSGVTATGIDLKANPDAKVISVDPDVIPLGSKVYVEGYGEAIAGDTGGGIKGNKIDIFVPSKADAINFGVKQLKVTILD
ncbi:LysM peptidoglycan-binding domain-containing protein [Caldibacillus lycopersici]|uniref:LysM peptidoglycan-binding domain-containing protein n=1 Tax=Perspicuibacillus lycopersici TaxID=1325689 RepID=A0AAE3ITL0_9BACI|nr:LysM peptidoglycan-binding and 3D domain-containing protein [Perspicuibacillus lycopersici]MCU9614375.1 LysM peptidoglycan-binding domain-containing protein [Perspicuibacillus lycopersici]